MYGSGRGRYIEGGMRSLCHKGYIRNASALIVGLIGGGFEKCGIIAFAHENSLSVYAVKVELSPYLDSAAEIIYALFYAYFVSIPARSYVVSFLVYGIGQHFGIVVTLRRTPGKFQLP